MHPIIFLLVLCVLLKCASRFHNSVLFLTIEVPDESIRAIWQEFNLCATGWGVCPKFFNQLCQAMGKSMGIESEEKANEPFFAALDTDKVGGYRSL